MVVIRAMGPKPERAETRPTGTIDGPAENHAHRRATRRWLLQASGDLLYPNFLLDYLVS